MAWKHILHGDFLRHMVGVGAGFDATILEFEGWVGLLLLEATQRSGFFRAAGQRHGLPALFAAVRPDFHRFIAEAVDLLVSAGKCTVSSSS